MGAKLKSSRPGRARRHRGASWLACSRVIQKTKACKPGPLRSALRSNPVTGDPVTQSRRPAQPRSARITRPLSSQKPRPSAPTRLRSCAVAHWPRWPKPSAFRRQKGAAIRTISAAALAQTRWGLKPLLQLSSNMVPFHYREARSISPSVAILCPSERSIYPFVLQRCLPTLSTVPGPSPVSTLPSSMNASPHHL